jgi:hypothetical protein
MTTSQIFASQMIEIDLGFDAPKVLNSHLIWELMIALGTNVKTKSAYSENESDNESDDCYYIDFGLKSGIDLYMWDFENGYIKLQFDHDKSTEKTMSILYSDFNIENILHEISKFTKISFDLDKIKKEITRQNDLHFD